MNDFYALILKIYILQRSICIIGVLEWWGIKLGDREFRFGGIGYPTISISPWGRLGD